MDIRLNKYLSDAGICSRREADRLIESGQIKVDGSVATIGQKISEDSIVTYRNKVVSPREETILLILNKPEGIECTTDKSNKDNIVDYVGYHKRIYPIGRLDKNSCGLIFLTNDGSMSDSMMRASNYHEKEYIVKVDKKINDEFIKKMSMGVRIVDEEKKIDVVTRKCKVYAVDDRTFGIVLTQGINRQIRRMTLALGYKVVKLKRIRIMNISIGNLGEGKSRMATADEIAQLKSMLSK